MRGSPRARFLLLDAAVQFGAAAVFTAFFVDPSPRPFERVLPCRLAVLEARTDQP